MLPQHERYHQAATRFYEILIYESQNASFDKDNVIHCRGHFPALNTGVYYGTGTCTVVNLDNGANTDLVRRLLHNPDVECLANFASGERLLTNLQDPSSKLIDSFTASFQLWASKVYHYYKDRIDPLYKDFPDLRRNFPRSIYPCVAFNFGPNVWTYRHKDSGNCPFGFCAIQALGKFDPTKGGHIILWEAGYVVEFPPGALILLPSATMMHSNVPIQEGNSRALFTQYAPGGLFRYADNGYRTKEDYKWQDLEGYQKMLALKDSRWEMGLSLLSLYRDIVQPLTPSTAV
ncbi:hypothetical protein C0992_010308 [Termitomyces sp. T32_za158]|nr:hypothetical protein C0992_010308 [Termitomyces sp. T32_za158]